MSEIPVGMDEAARHLGMSRRTLTEVLKRHPYYTRGGRANVFYAADLAKLRHALREETWQKANCIPSTAELAAPIGGFTQSLPALSESDEVLAYLIAKKQKKSRSGSRPSSGNVIPMASKSRSHSQRQ